LSPERQDLDPKQKTLSRASNRLIVEFDLRMSSFHGSLGRSKAKEPKQGWMDKEVEQRRTYDTT
jgi:hypothetical protein